MTFLTTPFWKAAPSQVNFNSNIRFSNDGIIYNIPFRDPVSTGYVYGDGNQNVLGEQKLVFSTQPEVFSVANILPTVGGIPRVNPYSWENRFNREEHTVRYNRI